MRYQRRWAICLVAVMFLPAPAMSDPGKNESGKGHRHHRHHHAESFRKQQEHRREARKKAVERQRKQMERRREARQKGREKARERRQRQQERYWEGIEERRERRWDSWEDGRWDNGRRGRGSFHPHVVPPSPGNFVEPYHRHDDYRYGTSGSYSPAPSYAPAPLPSYSSDYGQWSGYRSDQYDDDRDAVYTPFGFYEEYPDATYGGYGPAPAGYGRIGPYRFEVWED